MNAFLAEDIFRTSYSIEYFSVNTLFDRTDENVIQMKAFFGFVTFILFLNVKKECTLKRNRNKISPNSSILLN